MLTHTVWFNGSSLIQTYPLSLLPFDDRQLRKQEIQQNKIEVAGG